jgi:hypothetical protein
MLQKKWDYRWHRSCLVYRSSKKHFAIRQTLFLLFSSVDNSINIIIITTIIIIIIESYVGVTLKQQLIDDFLMKRKNEALEVIKLN